MDDAAASTTSHPPPPAPALSAAARAWVLAGTILASAMAFIDGTVVHVALPALQSDLEAGFTALQWVVNGYALTLGGLILVGGALGDRVGRRRIFVWGIALFALASLACALAPNAAALVAARLVQGVGAALLVPQSLAIIAASFPKDVRGRAIGIWAGASAITTALGPPLGGFLVDALSWRAVFWINLPLSAAAIWIALAHMPDDRGASGSEAAGPLDWPGALLAILGFGLVTLALTLGSETGIGLALPIALFVAGAGALASFVAVEARARSPLMPLSLFSSRAFTGANVVTLFLYAAFVTALFLVPFELQSRRGLSATQVGLTMLPIGLIIGTASRFSGAWGDRVGPQLPLALGSAVVALGIAGLAAGLSSYWLGVLAPIVVMSCGMALAVAPLTTSVMNAVDEARAGAASGVNNAASRLAGLFGVAIAGSLASALFFARAGDAAGTEARFGTLPPPGDPARAALEAAFLSGFGAALWLAAAWAAIAALVAWRLPPPTRDAAP
ncbi:DHA2 family efflux MFS transporter permease subunit [Salinarimonas ramus]|uniref:MFS transporter n=1 Tax=Salinarimonas ramus TaxID=690164 RepID=A0A917QKN3_9HYPH|nr:DHA2 family efflux MFS transporter permease subunit [Salinarimonas ramus]GGK54453.1 MFS transporter [Salinarimonas ramus]